MKSSKQRERQCKEYRDKNGRYSEVNHCEICKKSAGISYYSHHMVDDWGFGLVLCHKCAKATGNMNREEYLAYSTNKKRK